MPSVLLAWLFGHEGYASGQTLAIRRDTLQAIGGFAAIANHLADDNRLAELVRSVGQRVVCPLTCCRLSITSPNMRLLIGHELRWMRTLKVLRPLSFCFLFVTFQPAARPALPSASLRLSRRSRPWAGCCSHCGGCPARAALLHRLGDSRPAARGHLASPNTGRVALLVWCRSFSNSRITWRGVEFHVAADGSMRSLRGQ